MPSDFYDKVHQQYKDALRDEDTEQYNLIKTQIQENAEKGEWNISTLRPQVKIWLEQDGFDIRHEVGNYYNTTYYAISWKHNAS